MFAFREALMRAFRLPLEASVFQIVPMMHLAL
jgi:hypothetical protein